VSVLPPRTTLRQPLPSARTPEEVLYALKDVLNAIEGLCVSTSQPSYSSSSWALRIEAADNTWSRSARRNKKQRLDEVAARAQHPQTFRHSLNSVCSVISGKADDQNLCEINHDWMPLAVDVDDLGLGGKVDMPEEKQTVDQEAGYPLEFQWMGWIAVFSKASLGTLEGRYLSISPNIDVPEFKKLFTTPGLVNRTCRLLFS